MPDGFLKPHGRAVGFWIDQISDRCQTGLVLDPNFERESSFDREHLLLGATRWEMLAPRDRGGLPGDSEPHPASQALPAMHTQPACLPG